VTGNTAADEGGGIWTEGELSLNGSAVNGNEAGTSGGGIFNDSGTATLANSTVSGNRAYHYGGGIHSYGDLILVNSEVSGNEVVGVPDVIGTGGGINVEGGTLQLTGSSVNGNAAEWAAGIELVGDPAQTIATLTDSEVNGNVASGQYAGAPIPGGIGNHATLFMNNSTVNDNEGHGIVNFQGSWLGLNGSTVSGNVAGDTSAGGTGIVTIEATATLDNSTVSGNESNGVGGGLYVLEGTVSVKGSTISGNTAVGCGGGVANQGLGNSVVTLIDTQLVGNTATLTPVVYGGGGVCQPSDEPVVTLTLTLSGDTNIVENSAPGGSGGGILNLEGGVVQAADGTAAFTDPVIGATLPAWTGGVVANSPDDCAGPGTYVNVTCGRFAFGDHSYEIVGTPARWHDAVAYCEQVGGHLVTINSPEENQFVFELAPNTWLGATDEEVEGTWRWVTNEPFDYVNWAPNEPSNWSPSDELPEHYLTFWGGEYPEWNDVPDVATLPFVCEHEPGPASA
jgi:hypothetical protein